MLMCQWPNWTTLFEHNRAVAGPVKRRGTAATRTTTEHIYQGQAAAAGCGSWDWGSPVGSLVWGRKVCTSKGFLWAEWKNVSMFNVERLHVFLIVVLTVNFCVRCISIYTNAILFTSVMNCLLFASLRFFPQYSHGEFRIRSLASTGKHPLSSHDFCRVPPSQDPHSSTQMEVFRIAKGTNDGVVLVSFYHNTGDLGRNHGRCGLIHTVIA